jgi:MipA family protein
LIFSAKISLAEEDPEPYWEYGAGIGYVRFEHYPASRLMTDLILPFPTFQYRGKYLRADDRDGAHAYLFKSDNWHLEISGAGYPSLESSKNPDRESMPDLPWILGLGPQLVWKPLPDWTLSLSLFQAITSDFQVTKIQGQIYQSRLTYSWESGSLRGNLIFTLRGGSRDFLGLFYDINADQTQAHRPAYTAEGGYLSDEMAYFLAHKTGRLNLYLGGAWTNYRSSANRTSPLHKRDENLSVLLGMTYVLGESAKPEVQIEETTGIINRAHLE